MKITWLPCLRNTRMDRQMDDGKQGHHKQCKCQHYVPWWSRVRSNWIKWWQRIITEHRREADLLQCHQLPLKHQQVNIPTIKSTCKVSSAYQNDKKNWQMRSPLHSTALGTTWKLTTLSITDNLATQCALQVVMNKWIKQRNTEYYVNKWSVTDDVESCPLAKLNGGLSRIHSVDEDAVLLLTSYGSWHAYEKKK